MDSAATDAVDVAHVLGRAWGEVEANWKSQGSLRWQKSCLRRAKKGDTHAVAELYEALLEHGKKLGMSGHCTALTRLADIYSVHLGDQERGNTHIRTIVEKYPNTKYAEYARERLGAM